jgi:hypothetical protein
MIGKQVAAVAIFLAKTGSIIAKASSRMGSNVRGGGTACNLQE